MSRGDRTRLRILRATAALLQVRPGEPPSMSEIAAEAGATRQLLYFHFENRTALMVELGRLIDAEARTPELQATIDNAPDGLAALRAAVRVQGAIKPKLHGVATCLELLRGTDTDAEAACAERENARLARCRAVIDRLAEEGRLTPDWSTTQAAELFWAMTSMQSWENLVRRRGWSDGDWVRHTTAALEAALVGEDSLVTGLTRGSGR